MADLVVEVGDDGRLWVCNGANGTAIAVATQRSGQWFADGGSDEEVGPFVDLDALLLEIATQKLFAPWGNPGD